MKYKDFRRRIENPHIKYVLKKKIFVLNFFCKKHKNVLILATEGHSLFFDLRKMLIV